MTSFRTWGVLALLASIAAACASSGPPASLETPCSIEVVNRSGVEMNVTAFGRSITPLGVLEPGRSASFEEFCRVERISVRSILAQGDTIWTVAVLRTGETVRIDLDGRRG